MQGILAQRVRGFYPLSNVSNLWPVPSLHSWVAELQHVGE